MKIKVLFLLVLFILVLNYILRYFFSQYVVEIHYISAAAIAIFATITLLDFKNKSLFLKVGLVLTFLIFFVFLFLK